MALTNAEKCSRYYARHREERQKRQREYYHRTGGYTDALHAKRYGLTVEQYTALGDSCHVCGSKDAHSGRNRLTIDHDRSCCDRAGSCGRCVRGLLCPLCNVALGAVYDDPKILRALADYLEK